MNIKQCSLFFFAATAFTTVLRIILLSFAIEPNSGFIKSEYSFIATAILIVIFIIAVLTFVFGYMTKATIKNSLPNNALVKITSVFLGLVILYDTIFSTMEYSVSSWQKTLEFITAIIAAVALVSFALMNSLKIQFPRLMTVAPILFWLLRLVIIFSSFSSLTNIVDNIFELAALCLILVSSLKVAKNACLEQEARQQTQNFALLLTTALVCFVTSLPRAFVSLSGYADMLHQNDLPIMTTLIAGIYFMVFAFSSYKEN